MSQQSNRSASQLLSQLHRVAEMGHWQRVVEIGKQVLAQDPENTEAHYLISWAAIEEEDFSLADHHSQEILRLQPEDASSHRLRARYFREINRILYAKQSIESALRLAPNDVAIWTEYGWNCLHRGDLQTAHEAIEKAESLDPENLDLEMLRTAVGGQSEDSSRLDAYEQIEAYQQSLRLNPESPELHYNIGITYLHDLDHRPEALASLATAARLDPTDRTIQKALCRAAWRCDKVLRIIDAPLYWGKRFLTWSEGVFARRPILIIATSPLLILAATLVLIVCALWACCLYLPSLIYKYLTYPETLQRATGSPPFRHGIYRLPLLLRSLLFLLTCGVFFVGLHWFITSPSAKNHHDFLIGGGMIVAMILGIWISAKKKG